MDMLRAEVTARRSCPRHVVVRRVAQALQARGTQEAGERVDALCVALEREGEFTTTVGNVLHTTPLRAVKVGVGTLRVIVSLPGSLLSRHLPGHLEVSGAHRVLRFEPQSLDAVQAAITDLGGVVLEPEAWARLDADPIADEELLRGFDQRLVWEPETACSLERDGPLQWSGLLVAADGPTWRRSEGTPTRLWRTRTGFGRWHHAWTQPAATPYTGNFALLTDDEASRAVFALARTMDLPIRAELVRDGESARLRLRQWLPRAEYRYLSTLGEALREGSVFQWVLPAPIVDATLEVLGTRLGLAIDETAEQ